MANGTRRPTAGPRARSLGAGLGLVSLALLVPLTAGGGREARLPEELDPSTAQRLRLDAEQAARLSELDRVEARLLAAAARRAEWTELSRRHASVSEVACESAAAHVAAMEEHERKQDQKVRSRRKARLEEARASAAAREAPVDHEAATEPAAEP